MWVQRFLDGTPAQTATGFGTLNSSQVAFSAGPQNYLAQTYAAVAGLMLAAGLTPKLQFGEILWWFQANPSGMAFYGRSRANVRLTLPENEGRYDSHDARLDLQLAARLGDWQGSQDLLLPLHSGDEGRLR